MTPIVCAWPRLPSAGHVAAAAADRERDLEPALRREVRDLELRVEDLEVGGRLDVGGGDDALAALRRDAHLDLGRLAVQDADELLEVEDDVRDVLADARERRELVRDALDLDRGDGGALERGEQHAAQRVAERVAEAAVERLDHEDAAVLVDLFVGDLRDLEVHHGAYCQRDPFVLLRFERSVRRLATWSRARRSAAPGTGVSISARSGHFSTLPVRPSWSACSHGATAAVSRSRRGRSARRSEPDLSVTTSSGCTW